jgi:hypothetical protein
VVLVVIVGTVVLTGDDERPDGAALVSGTPDAATQVADAASATPAASATTEAPAVQSTAEATPNTVTADDTLTPITATDAPVAPGPTPTLAASVMIEGPITAITENVVTVFDLEIALEPQHPLLNLLNVGDIIRVEGNLNADGMILASIVSNIPGGTAAEATVGLEGPVESIDGNIIVINNVPVQLDADDPLLQSVQVGDFVSVEGNFEGSGTNIVLVVVDIVIVNNIIVDGSPYCWYHNDGMGMGHWHCDGMGMGMGMGDAMGMGMGD